MFYDLLSLLFPKLCIGCNRTLFSNEEFICTSCRYHLPFTNYHLQKNNPIEKTFWGRIHIDAAFSFLYFKKGNITQRLLHSLKYKGTKELGVFLGELYGNELKKNNPNFDCVISVPLHKSKLQKRGYNQSDFFAEGLSISLNIDNFSAFVYRNKATETQTKKSRFERWKNVEEIFVLKDEYVFKNKHILIVDDVITTGATIEALASVLKNIAGSSISVASIAASVK